MLSGNIVMDETTSLKRSLNILMVEDDPMEVVLVREILFESEKYIYQIETVKDGVEALSYLSRRNGYERVPVPDLILLDLNLPKMNGFDLLATIKQNEDWKTIPVFILTTSAHEDDKEKALKLSADWKLYVTKQIDS
jgi:CheY-like chemotaxis protein